MELEKLEDKVINIQNLIMSNYTILEELWAYHPSNEHFINPIKEYEKMKLHILDLEKELEEIEQKINILNTPK